MASCFTRAAIEGKSRGISMKLKLLKAMPAKNLKHCDDDIYLSKCKECGVYPDFCILGGYIGYFIRCPKCGRGPKVYQSSEITIRELAEKWNKNYGG